MPFAFTSSLMPFTTSLTGTIGPRMFEHAVIATTWQVFTKMSGMRSVTLSLTELGLVFESLVQSGLLPPRAMDRDRDRSTKVLIPQKTDRTAQDRFFPVLNRSGPVLGPNQS